MRGKSALPPPTLGGERRPGAKPGSLADLQAQLDAARRENRHLREQRDILKNVGYSLRTVRERYERIDAMKDDYSILALCENLDVSPSGYYDWQKQRSEPGPRAQENETLSQAIQEIHQRSRQTYGSPRIVMELRKKDNAMAAIVSRAS